MLFGRYEIIKLMSLKMVVSLSSSQDTGAWSPRSLSCRAWLSGGES